MASSVTVHNVNIRVNAVNLGFASGNSIYLMLTICTVTLEAMQYLYNIIFDILITLCTYYRDLSTSNLHEKASDHLSESYLIQV